MWLGIQTDETYEDIPASMVETHKLISQYQDFRQEIDNYS